MYNVWSFTEITIFSPLSLSLSQRGKKSASNFDPEFTKEPCRLSPVDSTVIAAIEPEVFDGFSFTNPEYYIAAQ